MFLSTFIIAQSSNRKSPPVSKTELIGDIQVTLDYSSPSVKGRELYGKLVPFDEIWRTGANEATKISLTKDVLIDGQALNAGYYSVFTIPKEDKWTLIFNKDSNQWGHYSYDEKKDALRVDVVPNFIDEFVESMDLSIQEGSLVYTWGNLTWSVSISGLTE